MFNMYIKFCTKSKERINSIYLSILILSIIFTYFGIYLFIETYFGASISLYYPTIAEQTIKSLIGLCSVILSLIVYIVVIKTINIYRLKIFHTKSDISFVEHKINSINQRNRIVLQAVFILISCFILGFNIHNLVNLFISLSCLKTYSSYTKFPIILKIVTTFLLTIFNTFILLFFNSACNQWKKQKPIEYNKDSLVYKRKRFIALNSILCCTILTTLLIVPFGWLMGLRVKTGTYHLTSIEIKNENISYSQFLDTTQNNFDDMTITIQPAFFNHGQGLFNIFNIYEHQNLEKPTYSINKSSLSGEYSLICKNTISISETLQKNNKSVFVFVDSGLKQYYYHNKELYFITIFSKETENSILGQEQLANQTANVQYEFIDYANKNYTSSFCFKSKILAIDK